MVLIVRKTNSLAVLIVLYIQVFTSPFHQYYRCTDCKSVHHKQHQPKQSEATIIVSDDTAGSHSALTDGQLSNFNSLNFCDRVSLSKFGNRSLICVEYQQCSTIQSQSVEQIRVLTCGLKFDGSIKVCCQESDLDNVDRSSNGQVDHGEKEDLYEQYLPKLLARSNSTVEALVITDGKGTASKKPPAQSAKKIQEPKEESIIIEDPKMACTMGKSMDGEVIVDPASYTKFNRQCGWTPEMENFDESRIIGGKLAKRDAWPWFALIMVQRRSLKKPSPECGATVISDRFILTAAHCVVDPGANKRVIKTSRMIVRLGEFDLRVSNDGEIDYRVSRIIPHPNFQPKTFKNDIALIELEQKVSWLK